MVDGLVMLNFSWQKSRKIVGLKWKAAAILKALKYISS